MSQENKAESSIDLKDLTSLKEVRNLLEPLNTLSDKEFQRVESNIEKVLEEVKAKRSSSDDDLNRLMAIAKENGINLSNTVKEAIARGQFGDLDVSTQERGTRAARPPRPAKYRYTDESGNEKTWTGQGRTPSAIKVQLDAGEALQSFLIDAES